MKRYYFIGGIAFENNVIFMKNLYGYSPVFSSNPLQIDIIKGIYENTGEKLKVFNLQFYPSFKKIFYSKGNIALHEFGEVEDIPFLSCRILEHDFKAKNLLKRMKMEVEDNSILLVYSTYYPFLKAVSKLKKKRNNITVCLIVPDLPQYIGLNENVSIYQKLSRHIRSKLFNKYNRCVDCYVLLTDHMNSVINPDQKKYIVVEGIADSNYSRLDAGNNVVTNSVVYSGTLQFKYGISTLLDAIKLVDKKDVFFEFYGDGEAKNKIIELSQTDPRIRYMGICDRDQLQKVQQEALCLINPRQNIESFTKYSFPSKNLEYMLSGRPVIAYMLDGMPREYANYIFTPSDNSPASLAKVIVDIINMPENERKSQGDNAKDFVTKEKNYLKQTQKILDMLYDR